MRNCLLPKDNSPTASCAGVRWNALKCAGVGHSLGTNRTPAAESADPRGADTEWSLWETRRGSDSADCPTLSHGRCIPLPVFVLPLGPHLGCAHVRVADGIAAPVAEPASGRIELAALGTANREGGPTPVAEAGIRRILVLAPRAAHRQAAERHAMPGLSPASTGEPPSESVRPRTGSGTSGSRAASRTGRPS